MRTDAIHRWMCYFSVSLIQYVAPVFEPSHSPTHFCRTPDIAAISYVMLWCCARCALPNISKTELFSSMVEQNTIFFSKNPSR